VNYSQSDPTYFFVPGITLVLIVRRSTCSAMDWAMRSTRRPIDFDRTQIRPRQSSRNHDAVAGTARYQGESGMAFAENWVRCLASARRLCSRSRLQQRQGRRSKTGKTRPIPTTRAEEGRHALLRQLDVYSHLDPQRIYIGLALPSRPARCSDVDETFAQGEGTDGTTIVPDMATDLGHAPRNAKTWDVHAEAEREWQDARPSPVADLQVRHLADLRRRRRHHRRATYAMDYLNIPRAKDGGPGLQGPVPQHAAQQRSTTKSIDCPTTNKIVFHLRHRWPTSTAR